MLQQSMTILSALAFVLGLVWVAVWFAKRYGVVAARPRARVAVEVVQRISMGPKTGLAVVRVGEKVMAVSMGPEGLRALFELDESDRQRIVASSDAPIAVPFSVATARALKVGGSTASAERHTMERTVTNMLPKSVKYVLPTAVANMFQRETFSAPASFADTMASALQANSVRATALPEEISASERDFRNMLNMTLSGATRLIVFVGIALLSVMSATTNASAQATPPVAPPPVTATPPSTTQQNAATQSATTPAPVPTSPAIIAPDKPTNNQPAFIVPSSAQRTARTATVRPAVARAPGSGAAGTTPAQPQTVKKTPEQILAEKYRADSIKASAAQKSKSIIPGSASRGANRTNSALPAPVAGGDEALAKMLPQIDLKMGDGKDGGLRLSGTVGIVVMMGLLTLLPTLVLMMTGFTRILIVLHFLKQAMGTQNAPPTQLLAAMALLLTGFVMAPTFTEINRTAVQPWMDGRMTQVEMLKEGVKPMRVFMLKQTNEKDLRTFIELSHLPRPNTADDVPLHVLTSSFVASELRRAFQIGFMIYLPFIIIDAVVASVLMSMGMFMLPPAMISMPFKLLLFVLVDGWGLIITGLVKSFVQ
ncbi:MAG: flagellar type III secretion system pore protein FliP [Gemmatimonas sp.]